ncbi:putative sugar phosphate/phosphate translocator [Cucurbita argyrosperma subsp. argyrosperma]|nr:putative sugar phosphate/phosphate translocator [Cucurbita argyrosperma subsp. argyrosperma]
MAKFRDRTEDFKDVVRHCAISLEYNESKLAAIMASFIIQKPRQRSPFIKAALKTLESIGALEEFMLKHQKDYVDMYRTTDQERDNIEHEVTAFIKACQEQLDILKNNINEGDAHSKGWLGSRTDDSNADTIAHKHGVVLILSEKLHSVTSQFDKLRAIRFQDIISKAVPRRKPNQINKPRSANTFAYNGTELREPDNFEHQPVRAQQQLLDDETRALQVELTSLLDAVQETETKMVEMSALNHLMSTHVLQQAQQIEFLYEQAVEATKNVELGNKELSQAIQRNSSSRTFLLLFLFVLTFSIIFLDCQKTYYPSSSYAFAIRLVADATGRNIPDPSSSKLDLQQFNAAFLSSLFDRCSTGRSQIHVLLLPPTAPLNSTLHFCIKNHSFLFFDQNPPPNMKGTSRFFTIGLVASWYSSNIGVLLLNKYLLSNYATLQLLGFKVVPLQTLRSRLQFFKISALSFIFCISVVFGNISLRYLPVSFNQAVGATTPFFTAVFAYLMTLKREAWLTYVTLIPVVTGVIIASGGEPSFHLFGFLICIAATAARALKSVLQAILLSADGEKLNSMNLLLYMAPMAVVFLLPATLVLEDNVIGITRALAIDDIKIIWYLLFNSSLAYFVNLSNFLVTKHTSALTLQVLGNAKGAVAVVVSILIFRNPVSVTGMMGYTMTVMGVILYSQAKKRTNKS